MILRLRLLKIFVISISLFCLLNEAKAQKTEQFSFALPEYHVPNSLYNKINLNDKRTDTNQLGRVLTGAFSTPAILLPKEPLQVQFNNILSALTDGKAQSGELLLNLRQLNFFEQTDGYNAKGAFLMRAELYGKTTEGYKILNKTDTALMVSSGDATNLLLKTGSKVISGFIAKSLNLPGAMIYTLKDITNIDSIEKSMLKVYTADSLVDGFYANYSSFTDQIPDGEIYVEGEQIKSDNVKAYDIKRRFKKLKPATVYAIVYKGKCYIGTSAGFAPVVKNNHNLFFISQTGGATNPSYNMMGMGYGVIGGALGGLATALVTPKVRFFNTQIDHLTGKFILLNEVPDKNY